VIKMIFKMKPCNITSRSLIHSPLRVINYSPDLKCAISHICVYYCIVLSSCLYSDIQAIKRSKVKNASMLQLSIYIHGSILNVFHN
jgi:FtsH-binding integral membrane protein